jgi:hypothetical protein
MKNITILLVTLIILMSSCTKNEYKPVPLPPEAYINFSTTDLAYVQIPADLHFIYKDSATGNFDSVTVARNDLTVSSSPAIPLFNRPATNIEQYILDLEIHKDSEMVWFRGVSQAYYGAASPYVTDYAAKLVFNASDNIAGGMSYGYSSDTGKNVSYQLLSSLTVESKTYQNVAVCSSTSFNIDKGQDGYYKSTYYWAKEVGIIKPSRNKFRYNNFLT